MRSVLLTLALTTAVASAAAADYILPWTKLAAPIDIPLELSANFAEFRHNHFHGGLDFKTRLQTGYTVRSVAPGYISRISVSPSGYGRALYVTHPLEGITTVYGHLSSFDGIVGEYAEQLMAESPDGSFDIEVVPYAFPVEAGEPIALSGNTGHSMGPHLHFEVRTTASSYVLDPLMWYKDMITDTTPPYLAMAAVIPAEGGIVEGRSEATYRDAASLARPISAWGPVYPAIRAYDAMDGQHNIYGVKYERLYVDGRLFWSRSLCRYLMSESADVNYLVDSAEKIRTGRWVEWTRTDSSHPLDYMMVGAATPGGVLIIDEPRDYHLTYELSDAYGNTSRYSFVIRGDKATIASPL